MTEKKTTPSQSAIKHSRKRRRECNPLTTGDIGKRKNGRTCVEANNIRDWEYVKESYVTSISIRAELADILAEFSKRHCVSKSLIIERSLDNFLTFSTTLYIIKNKYTRKFHIGYYTGFVSHDPHWHYVHNVKRGTVGEAIRNQGMSKFKMEIIGKFCTITHAMNVFRYYKKSLIEKGHKAYDSYLVNDDLLGLEVIYKEVKNDRKKLEQLEHYLSF